jgi:hypothetical protein
MYIESVPNRNSPPAILVRESYRDENGKVKKRTLANVTRWDPQVVEGLKILFKGGHASDIPLEEQFSVERSLPHGHVVAALGMFKQLGMPALIDRRASPERDLATALIVGRLIHPGSKLALSRHLSRQTATSTLGEELSLEEEVSELDLYRAMRWLLERQPRIERRLAKAHLHDGAPILYDLTSTYYEGSTCVLAQRGHNRDGKKGKRQINFGLLCSHAGCPVAVEVFPGSTADPTTVESQIEKLRQRFGIRRVVLVGDRGMLTSARIEEVRKTEDLAWISALQAPQVKKLAESGALQLELFDRTDLAEIHCEEHFPGERLVACLNPNLRDERTRKRNELLDETEKQLAQIAAACARPKNPYRGKDRIARRIEREVGKYKMLKHFELTITETSLSYERNHDQIAQEAALDGIYIVRAGRIGPEQMQKEQLVETYKSLSGVERAFRGLKTESLHVRPVFHREEDMVRAHIFLCMLAYHLQWHLQQELKPALFADEIPGGAPRSSPVAKARRSEKAGTKAANKKSEDGQPLHSLRTLLADLATLCRNSIRPAVKGADVFHKLTDPTPLQSKIFGLLKITPKSAPCSQ